MTDTNRDVLGDLFEGAITRGEAGQFLTPEPICEMMARMNLSEERTGIEGRKSVGDPCCGSGRMLVAAAEIQPNWHFVGQDIDLRCVRMTAINLALRNRYGHAIWGNSLGVDQRLVYETGRVEVWGNAIREIRLADSPTGVRELATETPGAEDAGKPAKVPTNQLRFFDP